MSPERAWFERWFDAAYLELYAHRDSGEAERGTDALLAPLGLAGRRVLDVACGPGRWTHAVHRRGARVVGLDLSWELLRAARAADPNAAADLVRGDMRQLPFVDAAFDLVLCMFTSFGYFATADEDRGALGEMVRVLRPQGTLVVDFLNAARLRSEVAAETVRTAGRWTVRETRRIDAAGERVVKEIELRDGSERRSYREEVRLWDAASLAAAFAAAGLEVVGRHGDYDAGGFDAERSPRLVLLGRRPRPA